MTNKERILRHLQFIYPEEAIISEIESATGVSPHSQVYKITQELMDSGKITGEIKGIKWFFKAISGLDENQLLIPTQSKEDQKPPKNKPAQFEILARKVFSNKFGPDLESGSSGNVKKEWDIVSKDGSIVGDAKYLSLVGGKKRPPAKISMISEHVWLLEKTSATIKFLVFGNQIEVPKLWLNDYGNLVDDVQFYFLDDSGNLTKLN